MLQTCNYYSLSLGERQQNIRSA